MRVRVIGQRVFFFAMASVQSLLQLDGLTRQFGQLPPQQCAKIRVVDVRSMEKITDADLERLARVAEADLGRFFDRNPHLHEWRERIFAVALVQGAAEHRLRGERGIWDLDVIVCFDGPRSRHLRRQVVHWDWGLSRLGRCP